MSRPGIPPKPLVQKTGSTSVGAATTYFHTDALGSILRHSTSAGSVIQTITYDAWGSLQSGVAGPFGFTGREWDQDVAMSYYRARYYAPSQGRFVSQDPIGFRAGPNFFAYVGSNPALLVDPSGLQPESGCIGCAQNESPIQAAQTSVCTAARTKPKCAFALARYGMIDCVARYCTNAMPRIDCTYPDNKNKDCGASRSKNHPIILYPYAFVPKQCGPLGTTMAHEMAHMCILQGRAPQQPNCHFGEPMCSSSWAEKTRDMMGEIERECGR